MNPIVNHFKQGGVRSSAVAFRAMADKPDVLERARKSRSTQQVSFDFHSRPLTIAFLHNPPRPAATPPLEGIRDAHTKFILAEGTRSTRAKSILAEGTPDAQKESPPAEGRRDGGVGSLLKAEIFNRQSAIPVRPLARFAALSGFTLIEALVATLLVIIIVMTAGRQIINVTSFFNAYRMDAILIEDVNRAAADMAGHIEMCATWTNNSGIWEGTFPVQVNGVTFETNRYTNVKDYRIAATNGAFVETLIRNPKEGLVTNTIYHLIANDPWFSSVSNAVEFSKIMKLTFPPSPAEAVPSNKVYRATFSTVAEWRWAGRTYTNRITVPRIIILYNKND